METILKDLGSGKKEIDVYLALVRLGISNASQIARETGLPRQTVYYNLDSLIEKELVEQSDQRGVRQFSADIFKLKFLIDKKKQRLEANKKRVDDEITKIVAENYSGVELPKVQFYQGREGLKHLLSGIIDVYKKGKHKSFRGYAINRYYPGMEEFMDSFVKERHKLGVQSKIFVSESTNFEDIGGQNTFGRKFKKIEINEHQSALYLVGNRIYIFSYKDGIGVMLENERIAYFLTEIFDNHWECR